MLKQDVVTPLYEQLMEEIEKNIKSGIYKPGDKIMTESEMAGAYGVSIITVRKAMGALMDRGLVVRRQGKGTFVTKPKFSRNMKKLQSFTEMCEQMGVKQRYVLELKQEVRLFIFLDCVWRMESLFKLKRVIFPFGMPFFWMPDLTIILCLIILGIEREFRSIVLRK